jgi:hypothetical protein
MSSTGPDFALLCGLAINPAAPLSILLRLASNPRPGFQAPSAALLDREHLPIPVAQALAGHEDTEIRRRLAGHPSTPEHVRSALAADTEAIVRAAVAAWPGSWIDLWRVRPVTASVLPVEVYR